MPILLIFIFLFRLSGAYWDATHLQFGALVDQKVEVHGKIVEEPDKREDSTRYVIEVQQLNSKIPKKVENVLMVAGPYSSLGYGDNVSLKGKLQLPKNFETTGSTTFDYIHFLAKDKIYYLLYYPQILRAQPSQVLSIKHFLFWFKGRLVSKVSQIVPEPELSLLSGVLLGAKQSLGEKLLDDFKKTGVVHMVVVSGYNITIVAELILLSLGFVKRRLRLWFAGIGVMLFVLMTGASSASLRAAIMVLVLLVAQAYGRKYNVVRSLLFAGVAMVTFSPLILFHDPSFQLSFLATIALIFVSPVVEPYFIFITSKYALRAIVVATVSTQVFLLPFLLYISGTFSLVALPVNLLVLFLVPPLMVLGTLTIFFSFVSEALAMLPGFVTYLGLRYILIIVKTAASFPFAAVFVRNFSFGLMLLVYLFYTFILWKLHHKKDLLKLESVLPPLSSLG